MSTITSIATRVPGYRYSQQELLTFADKVFSTNETDSRKLKFLYAHSGIDQRFSVIPDFNRMPENFEFFSRAADIEPVVPVEKRMQVFHKEALDLSIATVNECMEGKKLSAITHLITVTCTGLSAPGLDLRLIEALGLPKNIVRTSVNFMGCYAAIHALKIADAFCKADSRAKVMIVCTELCTLHFQKEPTTDNITSSLLFSDGCAAALVEANDNQKGVHLKSFYSYLFEDGKNDMAWDVGSAGFRMVLSQEIPAFIQKHFNQVVDEAMDNADSYRDLISHWCIHPGGRKILDAIADVAGISKESLSCSYEVLREFGNMSSATILFVLKKMMDSNKRMENIFGSAFGPGLTIETFTANYD